MSRAVAFVVILAGVANLAQAISSAKQADSAASANLEGLDLVIEQLESFNARSGSRSRS